MELKVAKGFARYQEAEMAREELAQQGIKAMVRGGPGPGAGLWGASHVGPAELLVAEKDIKKAKEILGE